MPTPSGRDRPSLTMSKGKRRNRRASTPDHEGRDASTSAPPQKDDRERPSQPDAARRRLGLTAIALGVFVALFSGYVVYAAFPGRSSGLPINNGAGRALNTILPQGWAFFTADPRATAYLPYREGADSTWQPITAGPLAKADNAFGFDRSPRVQDQQVESVVAGVQSRLWHICQAGLALASVQLCFQQDKVGINATNPWPIRALCGQVGIVAAQPVVWSRARQGPPTFQATRVLIVDLRC